MKTYNFLAAKPGLFVFLTFFSLLGGGLLVAFILPRDVDTYIFMLSFLVVVIFLFLFMIRMLALAKVEITLGSDFVSIKWQERFFFIKKRDIVIPFSEIKIYHDKGDYNWDWLKIEKIDGNIFRLWHSNWIFRKGDYEEFVVDFIVSIKKYNEVIMNSSEKDSLPQKTKIKKAKSVYETNIGLVLAGFCIIVIVGLPILIILLPTPSHSVNYFGFIAGYGAAIYYLLQVYFHRKRKEGSES